MRTVLLGPHRPRARRPPCRWLLLSLVLLSACTIEPAPTGPTTVTQTTTVVTTYPVPPTPAPPSVPVPGGANPPTSTTLPRTPDPVNGGTLPLPTYGQSVTQTYAASAAGQAALANSCPTGNSSTTWAFLDGLVDQLRQRDSRWGYLCKRGNCFDPSADMSWPTTPPPAPTSPARPASSASMSSATCAARPPRSGSRWRLTRRPFGRAVGVSKARRHAPRGPLVQRDPISAADPIRSHCKATNNRGQRCRYPPIPGGTVCRFHGGGAPQVKEAAMDRLLALQHPAIDRLTTLIDQEEFPTVAYAASRDVLDRTMGKPQEAITHSVAGTLVIKWDEDDE